MFIEKISRIFKSAPLFVFFLINLLNLQWQNCPMFNNSCTIGLNIIKPLMCTFNHWRFCLKMELSRRLLMYQQFSSRFLVFKGRIMKHFVSVNQILMLMFFLRFFIARFWIFFLVFDLVMSKILWAISNLYFYNIAFNFLTLFLCLLLFFFVLLIK